MKNLLVLSLCAALILSAGRLLQAEETPDAAPSPAPVPTGIPLPVPSLDAGWKNPPIEARMRCYWWWLNGNVDAAGITRDLEWMKSIGMGGGVIYDGGGAAGPTPDGPTFGTPDWVKLFQHTLKEADRLGLKMSLNPLSGWNLGGPSVTPEEATKSITWSSLDVTGPQTLAQKLPQPGFLPPFYRDTYVLAYPLPANGAKAAPIRDLEKKSLGQAPGRNAAILGRSAEDCSYLLFDIPGQPGEPAVASRDVVDLSSKLTPDGTLDWEVPPGQWEILRFGYTDSGAKVSTCSPGWGGRVLDYLDADALKGYWSKVLDPLLDQGGPLVGKSLEAISTDSWEAGEVTWTARFPEEFKQRRGYDVKTFLPVFAGRLVDNRDVSNRFLADFRKTIGDCMADNHYAVLAQLAAARNLFTHCEASGPHVGPFDGSKNLGQSEWPMSEFWAPSNPRSTDAARFFTKCAASAAHIYGKPIACAEGFTSISPHWADLLWASQKPAFDHEACAGLNLVFWSTFTSSPGAMGAPGQEFFAGTHLDPRLTWANEAHAFVAYLNRCQFLLQQGRFVGDVCYYYGDHVPNIVPRKEADPAKVLPGYDYDTLDEEVLLHRTSVKDGRIVLASGMTYRVLVLPPDKILSLPALKKVAELVHAGATVLGPKPEKAESLEGYPASDVEFKTTADALWDHGAVTDQPTKDVLAKIDVPPDLDDGGAGLHYIHRRDGDSDIYFVSNQAQAPLNASVTFRSSAYPPELWDPVSGTIRLLPQFTVTGDHRTAIPLQFGPCQSYFLIFRPTPDGLTPSAETVNFPALHSLVTLDGPWSVSFDPKWGGPNGPVIFDTLADWTARPEEGIRYYSGTATYRKTFAAPGLSRKHVYLDLGALSDLAEIRLNGKDLGVTWTPPFRVEVTGLLKPSGNNLEVDVVNTWYNRVLLDSSLPPEKRLTQTNVTLPKTGKPLASGLLGPVMLQTSD